MIKGFINGLDWNNCKVSFTQNESEIIINSTYRKLHANNSINANFTILVPRKFNLEVNTTGGDITLKNIEGVFKDETKGGKLDLLKIKGNVHLITMGGNVTVKDAEADGEVKTMGGQVLIENVIGDIFSVPVGSPGEKIRLKLKRLMGMYI